MRPTKWTAYHSVNTSEPPDLRASSRLRRWEWWLLGAGVALWVFLPRYQFTNFTGDWFDLGYPWKSGAMKIGYVDSFESIGVHHNLSDGQGGNLLSWAAVSLTLPLLLTLKKRLWPLVVARCAVFAIFSSALVCAAPGLARIVARLLG